MNFRVYNFFVCTGIVLYYSLVSDERWYMHVESWESTLKSRSGLQSSSAFEIIVESMKIETSINPQILSNTIDTRES